MRTSNRPFVLAAAAFFIVLAASADLHAYLDPGAGGLLMQLLLGVGTAAVVALRLLWRRMRRGPFGGRGSDKARTEPEQRKDAGSA